MAKATKSFAERYAQDTDALKKANPPPRDVSGFMDSLSPNERQGIKMDPGPNTHMTTHRAPFQNYSPVSPDTAGNDGQDTP